MSDTLIVNARLVNEGREFDADLRISRGRIDAIGSGLSAHEGETVVDANGRRLLPGMIDDQVHLREPGMEYKADMATESTAAAAGGRSEAHTSELQSLMRISYAVFCLNKTKHNTNTRIQILEY